MQRKKGIIVSFFNSGNMGDILICQQMKAMAERYWDTYCVDFSTTRRVSDVQQISTNTVNSAIRKYIKKCINCIIPNRSLITYLKIMKTIPRIYSDLLKDDSINLLIIGGGNMLMDTTIFPCYISKVYYALRTAKKHNKKTALICTGAGPIRNRFQLWYMKRALELCDFVSVRDIYSADLLNEICPDKEIEVWYDPAMSVDGKISHKSKSIGICVFFGTDKKRFEVVRQAYKNLILKLKQQFPEYRIVLFASEISDYSHVDMLYSEFKNGEIDVKRISTVQELLNIYEEIDVLISARMHGMITSLVRRTPVIGIGWQKKFEGLAEHFDMKDRLVKIENIEYQIDDIVNKVDSILADLDNENKMIDEKMIFVADRINSDFDKFAERI